MTLFIGPRQGGLEPVMSKVRSSPFLVTFIRMVSGSPTTPSLSTELVPSETPSAAAPRLADHAFAVDVTGALVNAVRDRRDPGTHLALGTRTHLGDRLLDDAGAVA